MPCNARKFVRVIKFLLAGVTVFCVSWIACVNEWHTSVRWNSRRGDGPGAVSTMRTIVAYSESKQAELDRPLPVACDRLPAFPEIPYFNRSWSPGVSDDSWQRVPGTRISLYAAFYDDRLPQRFIRILASLHGRNLSENEQLFCQTRQLDPYEDSVEVVAAKPIEIWWQEWDTRSSQVETPLLLSCALKDVLNSPSVVSVVTQPCEDPSNAFTLEPSKENYKYKRNFTICVKDLNFERDISQNLLEWIETNKILGVDMIDIYVDKINKETEGVLLHYRNQDYVRLFQVPIKFKSERTLWQRRRDHIISYNDCLYRNMRDSEYVVPLDVDEIVLPKIANTLSEMLTRLVKHGWNPSQNSAILIQNAFFFDFMQDANKYKYENIYRNKRKVYAKRDDVRITDTRNLDVQEIEIINEVIDFNKDRDLYDKYKFRCGKTLPVPKLVKHIMRSAFLSPVGSYSKSLMVTKKVLTAFNHYPLASLGTTGFAGWSAPFSEVQLNHYKESCNATLVGECTRYTRRARADRAALRLRTNLTAALANTICTKINDM